MKKILLEKCIKFAKVFFSVATFAVLFYMVTTQFVMPDERDKVPTQSRVFETKWQRVEKSGTKTPIEVPFNADVPWGEVVTLTTILPEDISDGEYLCFYIIWQDVQVYIDGELRLDYDTDKTRPFGKNSTTRYLFVELEEGDCGKELSYQFSSNSKYSGRMNECYIGDRASIWTYLVEISGTKTAIAALLILLSTFCILVCLILKYAYKKELALKYLAWTLFFCALWMLSESVFRQLFVPSISSLANMAYWSLMLIPLPLLLYINEIQKYRYQKWYSVLTTYCSAVFVVFSILQLTEIVQFVTLVIFIHMGLLAVIISLITTMLIDLFKKRIKEYIFVGLGIAGMLFTAVLEMVLYYKGLSMSMGAILGLGLLFLLAMAVIKTGQDMFQSEKKKQQAIAGREAQAKFLASMSHEIRTPINIIMGMNEMIMRENENPDIKSYAQNIENASNMLLGLINDVLDFTKIESGQMEIIKDTYSLARVLQDGVLILNARVGGRPISVQIDIDKGLPAQLYGDAVRIRQIMTNLLSNAAKYTEKGCITLKAYSEIIDEENIRFCISVKDTGIGIKEEDIPNLFDSFKRLDLEKNQHIQGTGLGLNIVKQLVESMDGCVEVESKYGTGSTFTVKIPQKIIDNTPIGNLEESIEENREKVTKELFTAPEAHILVVDDNQVNLVLLRGLLKRTKIKVDLAKSGKHCLEFTKKKKYHIILMDHMMPDLDGIETLRILRSEEDNLNKDGIVIALTANAVAGCKEMYLSHGFNDYFSKPIQADKLEELLRKYLPQELIIEEKNVKLNTEK